MENTEKLKEIWSKVLEKISAETGAEAVDLWIRPIKPIILEGNVLKLELPNTIFFNKISAEYEPMIKRNIGEELNSEVNIEYSISISSETKKPFPEQTQTVQPAVYHKDKTPTYINPSYNFESIVVGDFNRFAYTVAKTVAGNPGTNQNPFFIYSEPGMGKTHLLHAIGNEILKENSAKRILYISAESFVNEYITAISEKNHDSFRSKYRGLDCLFLDDIQFIIKKEKSEEEFFHTFNALFDFRKQIVVTSDKKPNDLELNDRLISRFKSGAIADIGKPEYEARVAILNKENENNKFNLPQDVLDFIAEKVTDSIRTLKGCVSTVGHYSAQNNIYPSLDLVQNLIKDYISDGSSQNEREAVDVNLIKEIIADEHGITVEDIGSKNRTERIAFARQIAIYLTCALTDKSLPDIGKIFDKDHSTIIYSRDKISMLMNSDPFFNEKINNLINKIKSRKR